MRPYRTGEAAKKLGITRIPSSDGLEQEKSRLTRLGE